MDAAYGSNMRQAIRGFQKLRQLPVSGNIDAATWTELERDDAPVLAVYADGAGCRRTLCAGAAGYGGQGQARHAGLCQPGRSLGERFHCSPELLRRLNPAAA
jgi:hypothetical protein